MGYVLSPTGSPLTSKPVEVKNVATGALVMSGATNNDGRWEFTLPDDAQQYRVEIGAGAGSPQKVAQAPASTEHEFIFVRYGAVLPSDTTINGLPLDPANPAQPYVRKAGDTLSGDLVFTSPAKITAPSLGHRLGALGPTAASVAMPDTDASIFIYRNSNVNWAGLGADGSGNLWFRTGTTGTPVPSLTITNTGAVTAERGTLVANADFRTMRPAAPTQGLIYFGNGGGNYLLWDAARLTSNAMPLSVAMGALGGASRGIALSGSHTADVSVSLTNNSAGGEWLFGVEGSRAALAPAGGFFVYQGVGGGTFLTIRSADGRVAIGPPAFAQAGATAQLDVKAINSTIPALTVRAAAGSPDLTKVFTVLHNNGSSVILGANTSGWVTDVVAGVGIAATNHLVNYTVAVYNPGGGFIGYVRLFNTQA